MRTRLHIPLLLDSSIFRDANLLVISPDWCLGCLWYQKALPWGLLWSKENFHIWAWKKWSEPAYIPN